MNLFDGFAITPIEIDVDGEEVWFIVTKNGEEVSSSVVHEGDKFRFKLDEDGDVGGILKRPKSNELWKGVPYSVDNNTNTICGVVTDLSEIVIAEPINGTWREVWMGENSEGGYTVTTTELQDVIHHWLDNIPVKEHTLSMEDLQEVIAIWLE